MALCTNKAKLRCISLEGYICEMIENTCDQTDMALLTKFFHEAGSDTVQLLNTFTCHYMRNKLPANCTMVWCTATKHRLPFARADVLASDVGLHTVNLTFAVAIHTGFKCVNIHILWHGIIAVNVITLKLQSLTAAVCFGLPFGHNLLAWFVFDSFLRACCLFGIFISFGNFA